MPLNLDDVQAELERGKVWECSLRDPRFMLDGMQGGEHVYIDPRPAILETLFHELLHRLRPRWGERRVTLEARRLLSTLGEADVAVWWRRYNRIKRKGRPVEVADE